MFDGWFPWRNKSGDWVDAANVLQGTQAFSSIAVVAGTTAALNAKSAITLDTPIQLLVRANGTAVLVTSREGASAPILAVEYEDGSRADLVCRADAELNSTTYVNVGQSPVMTISDGSHVALRFDPIAKPARAATLNLRVEKTFGSGPALKLFRLAVPVNAPNESTATLEGDSRVFFSSRSFEEPYFSNVFDVKVGNSLQQHRVVDTDRGPAVEITFDPRTNGVFDASVPFLPEAQEAAFEYDLKVLPTFAPSDGGKMPGWSSRTMPDDANGIAANPVLAGIPPGSFGTLLAGNGGNPVHGNDGWSLRGGHGKPWPIGHPLNGQLALDTYAYHADMTGLFGDSWLWSQWGPNSTYIGNWHRIYQRLRVNTPGLRDGVLEVRIDGKLVYLKTDVYLRDGRAWGQLAALGVNTNGGIGRVWLNMYHGGVAAPPTRFAAFHIRNLKVARFA